MDLHGDHTLPCFAYAHDLTFEGEVSDTCATPIKDAFMNYYVLLKDNISVADDVGTNCYCDDLPSHQLTLSISIPDLLTG